MTTNTFIKVANSFLRKYTPNTISYTCQLYRKSSLIDPEKRVFETINDFKGLAFFPIVNPVNISPLFTALPYIYPLTRSETPRNLLALIELVLKEKSFINIDKKDKIEALIKGINEVYEERQKYLSEYGLFVLDTKKSFLEAEHIVQINNTQKDLALLEEKNRILNKKIKSLQEDFVSLIGKFFQEEYAKTRESIGKPSELKEKYYRPIKNWNFLFPTVNLTPKVLEFYEELERQKKAGKNVLDSISSVNEQNAHKNLKGYVIYCESLYSDTDGFFNYDKRLTKSILNARVFETSKQAEVYAKRRGLNSSAIIEIDFVFAKVVSSHVQNMGPCMQSLISTRDSQNISEAIDVIPSSPGLTPIIKKNKI